MVVLLVGGCAINKRCVHWKEVTTPQSCDSKYKIDERCWVTKSQCVKWVIKGITIQKE